MRIRTSTRTVHFIEIEGQEVGVHYRPFSDDILFKRVGDKLVLAYIVHDMDPENPLTNTDCQGHLITHNTFTSTDDKQAFNAALCLDHYGEVNVDHDFNLEDGTRTSLWELASEDVDKGRSLYPQYWGRMVDPCLVTLHYSSHSGATVRLSDWDGNLHRPPNCVWLPDEGARENLYYPGLDPATLHERAKEYALCVASEYAKWVNGEVYGCVVETFTNQESDPDKEPRWGDGEKDAVWGHIGYDYALEALRNEYFEPHRQCGEDN